MFRVVRQTEPGGSPEGVERQHQRARAEVSRMKDEFSGRVLRCMRKLGCCQATKVTASTKRRCLSPQAEVCNHGADNRPLRHNRSHGLRTNQEPHVRNRARSSASAAAAQRQHQRARAEVSRVKDELSGRVLRCMRKLGCCQASQVTVSAKRRCLSPQVEVADQGADNRPLRQEPMSRDRHPPRVEALKQSKLE